jgi:putative lipoprotein
LLIATVACRRSSDATPRGHRANLAPPPVAAATGIAASAEQTFAEDRRRGVDFRALGQEPGWSLTIDDGHQMVFDANSMDDSVVMPAPAPEVNRATGVTTYHVESAGHSLVVTRTLGACQDPMTGIVFAERVTLTFDGVAYQGCGRRP